MPHQIHARTRVGTRWPFSASCDFELERERRVGGSEHGREQEQGLDRSPRYTRSRRFPSSPHFSTTVVVFSFVFCVGILFSTTSCFSLSTDIACVNMRYTYNSNGFNARDVPKEPVNGNDLRICKANQSCCTAEMEGKLAEKSGRDFEQMLVREAEEVRNVFRTKANKFDEYFRELLRNSRKDFHRLFKGTYGVLYEQNSHVFVDLFRDLEEYYEKGRLDLNDALKKFFSVLYQKMFSVLNAQFTFDEQYLRCVTKRMEDLKPFGDVPQKLSFQVRRSFVASRTYVQGLRAGHSVMGEMLKVRMSSSCNDAVMRMTSCPACNGLRSDTKPCLNYCLNVVRGCLALHGELHTDWDAFIDSLLKVGARLEGSFNIEEVVDPIAIQISDAIMNFQENGNTVSQEVFSGCGQPRLGKRSLPPSLSSLPVSSSFMLGDGPDRSSRGGTDDLDPITAAGTSIRRIVKDVREKVERLKGFWHELPSSVCSGESTSTGRRLSSQFTAQSSSPSSFASAAGSKSTSGDQQQQQQQCWTGNEKGVYSHPVIPFGLKNQGTNPEVFVDPYASDSTVNGQILDLKLITSKLLKAYDGANVQWIDYDDWKSPARFADGGPGKAGAGSSTDPFPFAYPWASGMAKEEVANGGKAPPVGLVEGSGDGAIPVGPPSPSLKTSSNAPIDLERTGVVVEGSGQGPPQAGTDLGHEDDEDFPFPGGDTSKKTPGADLDRDDGLREGSGAGPPDVPPSRPSVPTADTRPRPPAPPITGDPIHRVSSEEFDDFQRRYDDTFYNNNDNNNQGNKKKKPAKEDRPPKTELPTPPPRPQPTSPPPRRAEEKPSAKGEPGQSSSSVSRPNQSLLWSVFAPIIVTWIGGMVV